MESGKIINLMKFKIQPIAGDASFRKFYRLILNKKNKIIIFSKNEKYQNLIAYNAVNNFLRKNKILTPKTLSYDYSKGIMVIEDFGNKDFLKEILKKNTKIKIYKKLVDFLIKIQKIKPKFKIKSILKKSYTINKYSTKYLHKESDLFFDWYLPIFFSKKKVLKIKKKSKKVLSKIYNKLNFPNTYFVHRDYHLQNLMKVGNKIGLIDTQDALIGNPAYDLVSLIDDVRIKTSKKLKDEIYYYYLKKNSKINKTDYEKFLHDFKILSVQRSMKIIGIFSRLSKRDKKNKYLKFIPYTWRLLEMRMDSEIFSELKDIFNKSINQKIRRKKIIK
tara:strand:- start:104 stop:1099 length:996 start_codon:yes stop_codon:yes gene_type:complete